ncbi:hypothetical protein HYALB_00004189 [Hymenoscyphus albidus]|uniref:Necrosis inducing protein n=1 Tax=Hymenoscyphus albidus TaxID=595503 RepID=A0A9N9M4U4_9HELO|nr:hypothetical protein HYALB_00004189 [Hymenoscyphus albidus]
MYSFNASGLLALGVSLLSLPALINAVEYIDYNGVKPFAESYNSAAIKKFQPTLNTDLVLPVLSINGGCSASPGQVYARGQMVDGRFGIVYAWYFPKDQIALGPGGHRNDWEGVVVWADKDAADAKILAVCPSRHGGWHCDTSNLKLNGDRPKLNYRPDGTHAIFTSDDNGGSHPLIEWSKLPAAASSALEQANFGAAVVPLKDSTFSGNLNAAKF